MGIEARNFLDCPSASYIRPLALSWTRGAFTSFFQCLPQIEPQSSAVDQKFRATLKMNAASGEPGLSQYVVKLTFLYLNPTSGPRRMSEVAPEGLGALNDYASTKPGYWSTAKLRPGVEEIVRTISGIEEILALGKELDSLVTDRDEYSPVQFQ